MGKLRRINHSAFNHCPIKWKTLSGLEWGIKGNNSRRMEFKVLSTGNSKVNWISLGGLEGKVFPRRIIFGLFLEMKRNVPSAMKIRKSQPAVIFCLANKKR